jgi:hypothetical protein
LKGSNTLQKLEWKDLRDVWNKLCCVSLVRCPWGYSKCYYQTNDPRYDYFVKSILDCDRKMYLSASLGIWTCGIRLDCLGSQATILLQLE